MMPPARNSQTTMYAAAAATTTAGRAAASANALRLSSTAPKPMIVGRNATPTPDACAANSCIHS